MCHGFFKIMLHLLQSGCRPKWYGSQCEDTHKEDPNFEKQPHWPCLTFDRALKSRERGMRIPASSTAAWYASGQAEPRGIELYGLRNPDML